MNVACAHELGERSCAIGQTLRIEGGGHSQEASVQFLFCETYMFHSRKLSFHLPKDRLLSCERRSFATRNIYLSEVKSEK